MNELKQLYNEKTIKLIIRFLDAKLSKLI